MAGLGDGAARWALLAARGAAVALQALALLALRAPRPFARGLSLGLAAVALVAAAWTLAPVAATSACL